MTARITGLHTSNGGVPKYPVDLLIIGKNGCDGDKQNDLKHHGGTDKAVCLLQQEIIEQLNNEGHPISPGSTGENILINGLAIGEIAPGVRIVFPDVELVITQDSPPCKTIKDSFTDGKFNTISHKKFPNLTRWYAKVVKEGAVKINDPVEIIN